MAGHYSSAQLNIMYLSENHCPGIPDTLLAVGDTSYVWYLTNEPSTILSDSALLIFMEPGSYNNTEITLASTSDTIEFIFFADAAFCYCDSYIPNHFTPDGDIFNEEFYAVLNCGDIKGVRMTICSKMGKVVFDQTDYYPPRWNGRLNNEGLILKDDVYGWQVSFIKENDEIVHLAGHVTLAR